MLNQEPGGEICKLHELTRLLTVILDAAWQCGVFPQRVISTSLTLVGRTDSCSCSHCQVLHGLLC